MSFASLEAALPLCVLAVGALMTLLLVTFEGARRWVAPWTMFTLGASLAALVFLPRPEVPQRLGGLLVMDSFGQAFSALVLVASLAVTALSRGYWRQEERPLRQEFYVLLLLGTLGAAVLTAGTHFVSFFLGLELLSVSLYTMMGYARHSPRSLEASVKYLLLTATASAFLLFGMALVYAESGSMTFSSLAGLALGGAGEWSGATLAGFCLILVGAGFKLALVPFHMWTPDVYQGAPAPTSAFVATVSKAGVLAVLLRFLVSAGGLEVAPVLTILAFVAVASVLVGNVLALFQTSVKRILACSSIAHFGYALVAIVTRGTLGLEAASFYVVAYVLTILGAFAVVIALSSDADESDALERYRALFWRQPVLAGVLTGMLLSLAGIPLTAGFIGKVFVFTAMIERAYWSLTLILVLGSVLGLFYYLRVVVTMIRGGTSFPSSPVLPVPGVTSLVLIVLVGLVVWLGIQPETVLRTLAASVEGLAM